MLLNLLEKKTIVFKISRILNKVLSVIIVDYRGVNCCKMNELRKLSYENNVLVYVIRNNLIHLIFKNTPFELLNPLLKGPIVVAFSKKHPGSAARIFKYFINNGVSFKIKAAFLDGKILIKKKEIDWLSSIPSLKESINNLINIIKDISLIKLIRTFICLKQYLKK